MLERIRFGFERLALRGLRYRLLFAAAAITSVALIAGGLVAALDAGFSETEDAVWWAFLRLTDPGYLGDDQGLVRRTVSAVVTVMGYVLFLGLLIAILTQWLNEMIAKLESGVTPVALSNHVILLGWSHRTPTIVENLLRTGRRVQRFLATHGARELRIVILAEHVDDALMRELRERLGSLWNDRQVLLRSGTPLRLEHLERVAFRDAAVVILPGADFAERNPEAVDAETVKTLMSVSRNATASGSTAPLAVAEICDARRSHVARRAYEGDSEILPADEIVTRIIAQSIRRRGLCSVFSELLTLHDGNALYVREAGDHTGAKFGDLRRRSSKAILLGTVRSGVSTLNPDPDTVIEDEDLLAFVARGYDDCVIEAGDRARASAPVDPLPRPAPERRRVLIVGWSRKVPSLLAELGRRGPDAFEIDVVSAIPLGEREEALAQYASDVPTNHVEQIEAPVPVPGVLERFAPARYDDIVVLASERLTEEEQADANTVSIYLMLRGMLPEHGPAPQLLVELMEEENRFLFPEDRVDVIVSPTLVSYVLSQVSLRRELGQVMRELSQPSGPQIQLRPAAEYLATSAPVRFADLEAAAEAQREIALGLRHLAGGLELNPDRDTEWTLAEGDELVVWGS